MRILFIGDVFGSIGRRVLAENLKEITEEYNIEVCIANGENAAGGKGITYNILKKLHKYGVQIITGGNHSMVHEEVYDSSNHVQYLLRPLNFLHEKRGVGKTLFELSDGRKIGIINLQGRTFLDENIKCPFKIGIAAVQEIAKQTPIIIVDFHAEATSEKACLSNYLDGKVSAVIGTHTHIQTADERILPNGTAFITDVGMTGPEDSAIGMKLQPVIQKYLYNSYTRFEVSKDGPMFNAAIIDINDKSGKAIAISRIFKRISFTT